MRGSHLSVSAVFCVLKVSKLKVANLKLSKLNEFVAVSGVVSALLGSRLTLLCLAGVGRGYVS